MNDFKKRKVLVVGGASGFGLGCARELLRRGAHVAIGDVNPVSLRKAAAQLKSSRLVTIAMDVTSTSSVKKAVATCARRLGGLDTLVNSAGILAITPFEEVTEKEWDRILAVNLKGVFLCCQAASPLLRKSGRGRIVNISSDAGKIGFPFITPYSAAKAGMIGLSRAIAAEVARDGVTVNCLCPVGAPDTAMGQWGLAWKMKRSGLSAEEIKAQTGQSNPIQRNCTVEDVTNAILFFVSDESGFLTGQALDVDGGSINMRGLPGAAREKKL